MSELEDLEGIEREFARAARRRRRVWIGITVGLIGAAASPCVYMGWKFSREVHRAGVEREAYTQRATPAQIAALEADLARAEASLQARQLAWQAGMTNASSLRPRPDLGPCPTRLPLRSPASAERGFSLNNYDHFDALVFPGRQGFPHDVVPRGQLPREAPRVRFAREIAADLRERIRRQGSLQDFRSQLAEAHALNEPTFWSYDVVFFTDTYSPPESDPVGPTYQPGFAHGTAVLFDYVLGSAMCAGEVTAQTTSERVHYTAQPMQGTAPLDQMLRTEFEAEIERSIAQGLVSRAGPSTAPPTEPPAGTDPP